MTVDELLRQQWILAPATTGTPAMPPAASLTFAEIQRMTTPELQAILAAHRAADAERLAAYQAKGAQGCC